MIKHLLFFSTISLVGFGIYLQVDRLRYNKQLEIYARQTAEYDRELARLRQEYLLINNPEAWKNYCYQEILNYTSPV